MRRLSLLLLYVCLLIPALFLPGCDAVRKLFEKEKEKPKATSPAPKKRVSFDREPASMRDATPPPGYNPVWFAGIQPLDSAKGKKDLYFSIDRLMARPDSIRMYLHLMDSTGIYYKNGGMVKWKNMWCYLLDSTIKDSTIVKKFNVQEWDETNHEPVAAYLIADFSGSMGDERANFVQQSLREFVREKRPQDAFGLIKFDHYVNTVCRYTTDTARLLYQLKARGLEDYGGMTAINDALYKGITETKSINKFKQKFIIIFSDGYDNCSRFTKDSIITLARTHHIPICAIDFGDSTTSNYLEDIALQTGGTYHHIYSTMEFALVFRDVYRRMLNSYSVTFAPKDVGWHKVKVKLCLPDVALQKSAWVNNSPRTAEELDILDRLNRKKSAPPPPPALPSKMPPNTIVYYDFNVDTPIDEEQPKIKECIALMAQYSGLKVKLLGHTDFVGENDFNRDLSIRRCESVKRRMVESGISDSRIVLGGYGEERPVHTNATKEGRAKNRRVEIIFFADPPKED
jgi:outer membrane protein OmpA-like peptidoglycan-associated protein/Mg-chelatase subunit ChlD